LKLWWGNGGKRRGGVVWGEMNVLVKIVDLIREFVYNDLRYFGKNINVYCV
jgi:hypothetical protein